MAEFNRGGGVFRVWSRDDSRFGACAKGLKDVGDDVHTDC